VTLLTSWSPPGTAADPHLPPDAQPVAAQPVAVPPADAACPEPDAADAAGDPSPGRADRRAQQRAARKADAQARRRTVLKRGALIAGPVLAVVAVIALVATLLGGSAPSAPQEATSGRTQQTLMVQLVGNSGLAVNTALLGRSSSGDSAASATGLLIPATLLTQAPGAGSVTVGETARLGGPEVAGAAVADQFGVIVDDVWRLDRAGLAALVNAVGGIEIAVDREVIADGAVLLSPGVQRLDGLAAARYATYLADGETEPSRAARFADVLTAWLATAPDQAQDLARIVASPGSSASSTTDVPSVAAFLAPLAVAARGDGLGLSSAPVKPIDTGIDSVNYRLDREAAAEAVAARFAGSLPPQRAQGGGDVLVQNGVGTPGLGQAARERLVAAGFTFVGGGNASSFGRDASVVVIPDADPASRQLGRAVAVALGLPADAVRVSDRGQSVADAVVILGADFAP
jgi:hypothetical protein